MFNPLKNPVIVRTILDKAQEELNESLKFRKKQFKNNQLYMWVEIEHIENVAYISLKNELNETLVKMTAQELLEDKDIKEQLKKIPAIVRSLLNFKKIVPEINQTLCRKLGNSKFLKITEGSSKANINYCDEEGKMLESISLFDLFG